MFHVPEVSNIHIYLWLAMKYFQICFHILKIEFTLPDFTSLALDYPVKTQETVSYKVCRCICYVSPQN
jgi:hypothetical protein